MKKFTAEDFKAKGFVGYQLNTWTGNTVEADYVLRDFADMYNANANSIESVNDDVNKRVKIFPMGNQTNKVIVIYADRPMTADEVKAADERLAAMGAHRIIEGGKR